MKRFLVCVALIVGWPLGAAGQSWVLLESDGIAPTTFLAGETSARTLSIVLPDGATLHVPDALVLPDGAEAVGEVRISRALVQGGRVRWTVAYPFTAWPAGSAEVGAIRLQAAHEGRVAPIDLPPRGFAVAAALPGDGAAVAPAPPEGPLPTERSRWGWLPFAPLALAGLTGAGWWRRGTARVAVQEAPPAAAAEMRDPDELLSRGLAMLAEQPGAASVVLAAGARALPLLVGSGVTPAMTTTEVTARLGDAAGSDAGQAALRLLVAADRWIFGHIEPDPEALAPWAESLRSGAGG